jgi:acid phosphatase family membrane protein YuiD
MLALLGIATVLVAFLRIARSAHTPFDVAMGVATGTYLFWLVYYILTAASAALPQRLDADIFAISAVFLPLFVFYSQHAIYWSVSSIGIIIILGLVHYLTPFRAPRRP